MPRGFWVREICMIRGILAFELARGGGRCKRCVCVSNDVLICLLVIPGWTLDFVGAA